VLSKDEQASYLNFMTAAGTDSQIYEEHLKVYQEQNRETLPKETLGLLEHFRSGGSSSNPSSVWIVNPKADKCVDLEGAAFTKDLVLPDAFLEPSFTNNLKVKRTRIINISLDVQEGKYRNLTDAEVAELNKLIEPSSKTEEASLPSNKSKFSGKRNYGERNR
jgi:hypothetical protein